MATCDAALELIYGFILYFRTSYYVLTIDNDCSLCFLTTFQPMPPHIDTVVPLEVPSWMIQDKQLA